MSVAEIITLFGGGFLVLIVLLELISRRTKFPYMVALLIAGLLARPLFGWLGIELPVGLPHELTYYVLLPLLLFESAQHINFHQFHLQFRTISFLASFGLLLSLTLIGVGVSWLFGLPLSTGLLFGAIISATDPISVLALFKTLGVPKRLSLLVDGESMFNDATAVLLYRILLGVALAGSSLSADVVAWGAVQIVYSFFGSIALGAALGYLTIRLIGKIDNHRIAETTLTFVLALMSFSLAEDILHLSGVITTVMAGIVLGQGGLTRIEKKVGFFIAEIWEYVGFISLSLIFFFVAYELEWTIFAEPLNLLMAVAIVLVARAVSVYLSFWVTNRHGFFAHEPNVPHTWQHVIQWGGVRGVIPLVLVYTLPPEFVHRELLIHLTLATIFFTLFINTLTIKPLLTKLGIHLSGAEERILEEERELFALSRSRRKLKQLGGQQYDRQVIKEVEKLISEHAQAHRQQLDQLVTPEEFSKSIGLQVIALERKVVRRLFHNGAVNENVFYQFQNELDLQEDALLYPEVYEGRGYQEGGQINRRQTFWDRLNYLSGAIRRHPLLAKLFRQSREALILERCMMLQARQTASDQVLDYLDELRQHLPGRRREAVESVQQVEALHREYKRKNQSQIDIMRKQYPDSVKRYERSTLCRSIEQEGLLVGS